MREERGDVKRGRLNDSLKGRDGWPIRAKGEGERGQMGAAAFFPDTEG